MYNHLIHLAKENYGLDILNISKIADHSAKVYLLQSASEKYALKEMGPEEELDGEVELTAHLLRKGIHVPRLYLTRAGDPVLTREGLQYILYEYIEGTAIGLNAAPAWFLVQSARTLGQIQSALKDYRHNLPVGFGQGFFAKEIYEHGERDITDRIRQAETQDDTPLALALRQRLRHIQRVSRFVFDCDRLTYVTSHGDFYVNQVIVRDGELVTLDWTHPGVVPACFEVLMSYAYADPACEEGVIDIAKFKPYLSKYLKYAPVALTPYDLKMMPYFLYHYCIFCSFTPPYEDLPEDYRKIARLTDRLANWFYENVKALSDELCAP